MPVNHMATSTKRKIIYDFGANNGDDLPYYLKKSDLVVAVEANPLLVQQIEQRFAGDIQAGRLIVRNNVLAVDTLAGDVVFYIHKTNHVLSQFPPPDPQRLHEFEPVALPSVNVVELIRQYGDPYYIKIDIEHYDADIVRALFEANIRPPYISAESHDIEVFALLLCLGGYRSFKLVDGASVSRLYKDHCIETMRGLESHSFPHHSAGPFGDDVIGPWLTPGNFFQLLAIEGLGWKDIHASSQIEADPLAQPIPTKAILSEVQARRAEMSLSPAESPKLLMEH